IAHVQTIERKSRNALNFECQGHLLVERSILRLVLVGAFKNLLLPSPSIAGTFLLERNGSRSLALDVEHRIIAGGWPRLPTHQCLFRNRCESIGGALKRSSCC